MKRTRNQMALDTVIFVLSNPGSTIKTICQNLQTPYNYQLRTLNVLMDLDIISKIEKRYFRTDTPPERIYHCLTKPNWTKYGRTNDCIYLLSQFRDRWLTDLELVCLSPHYSPFSSLSSGLAYLTKHGLVHREVGKFSFLPTTTAYGYRLVDDFESRLDPEHLDQLRKMSYKIEKNPLVPMDFFEEREMSQMVLTFPKHETETTGSDDFSVRQCRLKMTVDQKDSEVKEIINFLNACPGSDYEKVSQNISTLFHTPATAQSVLAKMVLWDLAILKDKCYYPAKNALQVWEELPRTEATFPAISYVLSELLAFPNSWFTSWDLNTRLGLHYINNTAVTGIQSSKQWHNVFFRDKGYDVHMVNRASPIYKLDPKYAQNLSDDRFFEFYYYAVRLLLDKYEINTVLSSDPSPEYVRRWLTPFDQKGIQILNAKPPLTEISIKVRTHTRLRHVPNSNIESTDSSLSIPQDSSREEKGLHTTATLVSGPTEVEPQKTLDVVSVEQVASVSVPELVEAVDRKQNSLNLGDFLNLDEELIPGVTVRTFSTYTPARQQEVIAAMKRLQEQNIRDALQLLGRLP